MALDFTVIGQRIKNARLDKNLTQEKLAEKLNVSQTVVSKIETCERRIDVIELIDICGAINTSYMDFFSELNDRL